MKLYSAADVYPFWKYFHFSPKHVIGNTKSDTRKNVSFYFPSNNFLFSGEKKGRKCRRITIESMSLSAEYRAIPRKRIVSDIDLRVSVVFVKFINLWFVRQRKIVGSDYRRGTQKSFRSHLNSLALRSIDREPFKVPLLLLINKFSGESVKFINISCHFV